MDKKEHKAPVEDHNKEPERGYSSAHNVVTVIDTKPKSKTKDAHNIRDVYLEVEETVNEKKRLISHNHLDDDVEPKQESGPEYLNHRRKLSKDSEDEAKDEEDEATQKKEAPGKAGSANAPKQTGQPPKKTESAICSCWNAIMNYISTKTRMTFFTDYNKYFNSDYKEVCSKDDPVGNGNSVQDRLKLFYKGCDEIDRAELSKKYSGEELERKIKDKVLDIDRQYDIPGALMKGVKTNFIWAVIFRILRNIAAVSIPFILNDYLKEIKKGTFDDMTYALELCLGAGMLTFLRETWNQIALKYTSLYRVPAMEQIRASFFMKLSDTNIEFMSKTDASFVAKMLLYETIPIHNFMNSLVNFTAAPVSIIYAYIFIFFQFQSRQISIFIIVYSIAVIIFIAFLHRRMIVHKKIYRALGCQCSGHIEEMIEKTDYIRANSMQSIILRKIWGYRKRMRSALKTMNGIEAIFDLLFSSPVLASTMVVFSAQQGLVGDDIDAATIFTLISAFGSLRAVFASLSEGLGTFQDYQPSMSLFKLFYNKISLSPKIAVLRMDSKKDKSVKFRVQTSKDADVDKIPIEDIEAIAGNDAVVYDRCTFVDKSNTTNEVLKTIFRDDYLGFETTAVEKGTVRNMEFFNNMNLRIPKGSKVCVMGIEKSGIQWFMESLCNEYEIKQGRLIINGTVVHFDFTKMKLLDEPLLDNITLGTKVNYQKLDKICAALGLFAHKFGDGLRSNPTKDKGLTSLEKTKILLARCLFQPFDTFLISNLFSNLGFEEKVQVFEDLVCKYLKFDTVVYQANDAQLAYHANLILVFKDGKIVEQGTFAELSKLPKTSTFKRLLDMSHSAFKSDCDMTKSMPILRQRSRRRVNMYGIEEKQLKQLQDFYVKTVESKFFCFCYAIIILKRALSRKVKSKAEKKLEANKNFMLSTSIFSSFQRLLSKDTKCTFFWIGFLFFLSCLLGLAWDTWIAYWKPFIKIYKNESLYFTVLIIVSFSSDSSLIIRNLLFTLHARNMSTNIFFKVLKKMIKASTRWIDLVTKPRILNNLTSYQTVIDEDFNKALASLFSDSMMALFSLTVCNIFYPGLFALVTVFVVIIAVWTVLRFSRSVRIWIAPYYRARIDLFKSFLEMSINALSMRQVNQDRFMYKRFEQATHIIEIKNRNINNWACRWMGIRVACITGVLIFFLYLFPVAVKKLHIWEFNDRVWMGGLVLVWSSWVADSIARLMNNLATYIQVSESGERLLELQEHYPKFISMLGIKEKGENLEDELNDSEMQKIFLKVNELDALEFEIDPKNKIVELINCTHEVSSKEIFSNVNLSIYCGDRVILVETPKTSSTVDSILDIIMGFQWIGNKNTPASLPKEQKLDYELSTDSVVKVYGKDISGMNVFDLRRHLSHMISNPPLFTGTFRENIDPFGDFKDEDMITTLHYLGFYNAYCAYVKIFNPQELLESVDKVVIEGQKEAKLKTTGCWCCKKTRPINDYRVPKEMRMTKSKKVPDLNPLPKTPQIPTASSNERRKRKLKTPARPKVLPPLNPKLKYPETKRPTHLSKYKIEEPMERKIVENLLQMTLNSESKHCSLNLRRIVQMTRVMLEKPELLILEEDSLNIEGTNDSRYLNQFFTHLKNTTIICKAVTFANLHRFAKCATFDSGKLVEYDRVEVLAQASKKSHLSKMLTDYEEM